MELRDLNGFEGSDRNIWNITYNDRDMEYEIWNMMIEIWMISCIIDMEYIYIYIHDTFNNFLGFRFKK